MLYKTGEGAIRLFRQGDDFHPERKGKIRPQPEELPAKYRDLVRWYDEEYSPRNPQSDPVLAMSGAGKQMWRSVDADDYVNALRSNWEGLPEGR